MQRITLLLLLAVLGHALTLRAVSSATCSSTACGDFLTWQHEIPPNTIEALVVVSVSLSLQGKDAKLITATYDNVIMNIAGEQWIPAPPSGIRGVKVFYLRAPRLGTQDVIVNWPGSAGALTDVVSGGAVSYEGAEQVKGLDNFWGGFSATQPVIPEVQSKEGNIVQDVVFFTDGWTNVSTKERLLWSFRCGSNFCASQMCPGVSPRNVLLWKAQRTTSSDVYAIGGAVNVIASNRTVGPSKRPTTQPTNGPTRKPSTPGPTNEPTFGTTTMEPTTARKTSQPTTSGSSLEPTSAPTIEGPTNGPTLTGHDVHESAAELASFFDSTAVFSSFGGLFVVVFIVVMCFRSVNHHPGAHYLSLFFPVFSLFDFILDCNFVLSVWRSRYPIMAWISFACVAVPLLFSVCALVVVLCRELKDREFSLWFEKHEKLVGVLVVLCASNPESLLVLRCRVGNLSVFSAPLSTQTVAKIKLASMVSLVLEDVPQLAIQSVFVSDEDGQVSPLVFMSLFMSAAMIATGIVERILGYVLYNNKTPEYLTLNSAE